MTVVINGTTGISTPGVTNSSTTTNTGNVTNSGTVTNASTISVGGATPSASGAGITFPATQSASTDANTLDDYEEGTWTPVIKGGSTAGTNSLTINGANYVKIGRQVFVSAYLSGINLSGYTGALQLFGLPFTNIGTYTSFAVSFSVGWGSVPGVCLKLHANPSATTGDFCFTNSGGTSAGLQASDIASLSSAIVIFAGCYLAT